ncbi:MAG: hypothetical protein GY807_21110 [Gammaproteobacteria bacterium]|nr:hypothetical protein [Gammaproteobacteria bacterium]
MTGLIPNVQGGHAVASGALWYPSDLDVAPVLWLDVYDGDSITEVTGVSEWANQMPDEDVKNSTGSEQPILSSTSFDGDEPGITFDGTDDYLATDSGSVSWHDPDGAHTDFAFMDSLADRTFDAVIGVGCSTSNAYILVGSGSGGVGRAFVILSTGTKTTSNYASDSVDILSTSIGIRSLCGVDSAGTCSMYLLSDGNDEVSGSVGYTPDAGVVNLASQRYVCGARNYNGAFDHESNIVLNQVVVCEYAVTSDERAQLEGFAFWQAGKQADLPSAHDYIGAAPTASAQDLERRMDRRGSLYPRPRAILEGRVPLIVPKRKLIVPDNGWKIAA